MRYKQLSRDERVAIEIYLKEDDNQKKKSINQIAKLLKRNKSTISREIKRNSVNGTYTAEAASYKFKGRQRHKYFFRIFKFQYFWNLFKKYFDKRIHGVKATWYKIVNTFPGITAPNWRSIFIWIKKNKWFMNSGDRLRRGYVKGRKRNIGVFSKFKDKFVLPIWTRAKSIDLRLEFGHWEADLIIGKRANGFENLLTLTERKTRMTYIAKIKTKNSMKCNSEIKNLINRYNLPVKSITVDNGIEFKDIGLLAKWLNINVYLCEPYASYQRGSNENVNGIIRRFWKKGTDFSQISTSEIIEVQDKINKMPREMFDWKSSFDVYKKYLA